MVGQTGKQQDARIPTEKTTSQIAVEPLDMDLVKVDPQWALRVPANLALRRQLLPFSLLDGVVQVACADANDQQGLQAVERYVGQAVQPNVAQPESLKRIINSIFKDFYQSGANVANPARVRVAESGSSDGEGDDIIALGDEIFHAALIRHATDIHIEPSEKKIRVRLRVDGALEEYRTLPPSVHSALVSRIKVISGMDIAERRAPQDGRFSLKNGKESSIDVRTATIPTKHGERMTMRLLAAKTHDLTLEKLGMLPVDTEVFGRNIRLPNGLILLTGPTGCGKSTTLYAAMRKLIAERTLNVMTIEDPVEYMVDGISQVEVDSADKVSFHKALRSTLRHDPDILMIGEIRDQETASIAIKAALTGHLVFTTLHTNSALNSVSRLIEMGVKPFLLGSVSRLFIAQRLVRGLCQKCKKPTTLTRQQSQFLEREDLEGAKVFEPGGCKYCDGSGLSGRTALFEMLDFDKDLVDQIGLNQTESKNRLYLEERNTRFLIDDAIQKMELGLTTFDEITNIVSIY